MPVKQLISFLNRDVPWTVTALLNDKVLKKFAGVCLPSPDHGQSILILLPHGTKPLPRESCTDCVSRHGN